MMRPKIDSGYFLPYLLIILAALFAEVMTYDRVIPIHPLIFSTLVGGVGGFGFYMNAQLLINRYLFRTFAWIALGLFTLSLLKQAITVFSILSFLAASLPFCFLGYTRLLLWVFYKEYPLASEKPTVVFPSKSGAHYRGPAPTRKARWFSFFLFLFFYLAFGLGLVLLKSGIK